MAEDPLEKTEPATPKKREDARKKGEVAVSRDLNAAVMLTGSLALATSGFAVALIAALFEVATGVWSGSWVRAGSISDYHAVMLAIGRPMGVAAFPLLGLMVVMAVGTGLLQVGPLFTLEALEPKFNKLNPITGVKRLFSLDRVFDLAKSLLKFAFLGSAAAVLIRSRFDELLSLGGVALAGSMAFLRELQIQLAGSLLVLLAVLAVVDLLWVRWRFEEKLKMSTKEVRDEHKQREGSPEIRGRIRSQQRELSRARMMAAVASADVVIRNPTHYAVALAYDRSTMTAPRVVALGRNHVALRIIEIATSHRVPVVENRPVARLLYRTAKLGQEIPEALFQAVAEILAQVMRAERRFARRGAQG